MGIVLQISTYCMHGCIDKGKTPTHQQSPFKQSIGGKPETRMGEFVYEEGTYW